MTPARLQKLEDRGRLRLLTASPYKAHRTALVVAERVSFPVTYRLVNKRFEIIRKD